MPRKLVDVENLSVPKEKNYIEWEGVKLIIEEKAVKSMKSKSNQFNTPSQIERKPFKRTEGVTFELIIKCLLGAFAWGALMYGLINWASS